MSTIIQCLWIGRALSPLEQLSIRSFLANGHEVHLYLYEQIEGVPRGTRVRNAERVLPRSAQFLYREHPSYAGFSNFFRYRLLLEKGGWWVDLDTICLRPFDFRLRLCLRQRGRSGRRHESECGSHRGTRRLRADGGSVAAVRGLRRQQIELGTMRSKPDGAGYPSSWSR